MYSVWLYQIDTCWTEYNFTPEIDDPVESQTEPKLIFFHSKPSFLLFLQTNYFFISFYFGTNFFYPLKMVHIDVILFSSTKFYNHRLNCKNCVMNQRFCIVKFFWLIHLWMAVTFDFLIIKLTSWRISIWLHIDYTFV